MDINEIEIDHVYFDYGDTFPRKVLEIDIVNGIVICCDVSYTHGFYICPVATRHSMTLEEFAEWAQIRLTEKAINTKAVA
jgi:hypothetical protein